MRLLLFFLILSNNLFAQKRDSVFVKTEIYEVMYSETLEQPLWLKYKVICRQGTDSRVNMDFLTCDSIHTSNHLDYENNIWDRGHLAPAANFNCNQKMLLLTFSYLNCALQHEKLNRGVWKSLEIYERELAKTHPIVEVKIYCKYSKKSKKLRTGATVPDGFYKIITYSGKTIKFYFPNKEPKDKSFLQYLVK